MKLSIKKSIFFMIFLFIIILCLSGNKSYAATVKKTYDVSNTITGSLDSDGVLTISGTGEMPAYNSSQVPWKDDNVNKVVVNPGITKIGAQDFAQCTTVTQIELGNTITSIDKGAFAYCTGLTSVTLPSSVESLGEGVFTGCTNLSSIYLNEGLKDIGLYAFQQTKLKNVEIPSTLTHMSLDVFFNVTTIENFSVRYGNNETFYTDKGVLYNHYINQNTGEYTDDKQLVCYPVANTMTSYEILDGTTHINQSAFKNALNLKQVTFPKTIKGIGADSFNNTGLTSLTIPDVTLTAFGPSAFENNKDLKTVNFNADLNLFIFTSNHQYLPGCFKNCKALEQITFNSNIEEFGTSCFEGCISLKQITLPSTLKKIDMSCFQGCISLTDINLPECLESIGYIAFANCINLNQVNFPSSIVEVHKDAFLNCTKITTKYPDGFELKEDNFYRKTMFVTISGTYDYDQAYKVFELVNEERKAKGLSELKFDVDIANAAMDRAAELSLYYSHTRPNLSEFSTVLDGIRIDKIDTMRGENIAAGYGNPESVMNGWMNSDGHRANILNSNFSTMGIGCYRDSAGSLYWVQIFVSGEPNNIKLDSFKGTKYITKTREISPNLFNIEVKESNIGYYPETSSNINVRILNSEWSGHYTYAENSEVTYKIADTSICVLEDGNNSYTKKLKYLKPGTTTLTATLNGKSSTITITVQERKYPLQGIKVDPQAITLEVGETYKLGIIYNPSNTTDNKTATWTSMSPQIVSVDQNGKITALKAGTSYVYTKVGRYSNYCKVTVVEWNQFKDVKSTDWFYNAVKYTYKNGLIMGYDSTTFAPYDKATRGMIVTILYRMEGSPSNNGISKFTDVDSNEWYANAIKWASDAGIIHGYEGTNKFGPADTILRQDLAVILRNYAKYKKKNMNVTANLSKYSDYKKVDSYANAAMQWAVGTGVITGNDDGTLTPQGVATRAEAVAMIQKYCQRVGR